MTRRACWLGLLVSLGCNGAPLSMNSVADLGSADQGSADLARGPFCSDVRSPRAEVNGMLAVSPSVSAHADILNCCNAASIEVISMQLTETLALRWRQAVGPTKGPNPITLDLAQLPAGWNVSLEANCDATGVCADRYTSGLTGTLTVDQPPGGVVTMSACVDVAEPNNAPHPLLHVVHLWVPSVTTH